MAKGTAPLAIKMEIRHRGLLGEPTRILAKEYRISQPTTLNYMKDAVEHLIVSNSFDGLPALRMMLSQPIRSQSFAYQVDTTIAVQLQPIIAPFLEQAKRIDYSQRESSDVHLGTKVSATEAESFEAIVKTLSIERPGLTSSELLREIIREYISSGAVPEHNVSVVPGVSPREQRLLDLVRKNWPD